MLLYTFWEWTEKLEVNSARRGVSQLQKSFLSSQIVVSQSLQCQIPAKRDIQWIMPKWPLFK